MVNHGLDGSMANEALQHTIFQSRLATIREFRGEEMARRVLWANSVEKLLDRGAVR
jgi:hypothetical protein